MLREHNRTGHASAGTSDAGTAAAAEAVICLLSSHHSSPPMNSAEIRDAADSLVRCVNEHRWRQIPTHVSKLDCLTDRVARHADVVRSCGGMTPAQRQLRSDGLDTLARALKELQAAAMAGMSKALCR